MKSGNPLEISQSEVLATEDNINLVSALSGGNLSNDLFMLMNPTSNNR